MQRTLGRCVPALVSFAALALSAEIVAAQVKPVARDHSQEAVVVERARTTYRFEKDGTGRRDVHMRIKTQSEAGVQQWGQLLFGYNSANERPDIAFVRVYKPDGSTVETAGDAVQDLSSPVERIAPIYTDFRQKHVTVQSLRPGDTLEFLVATTIHTPLAPGHFWAEFEFQRALIVLDEQLEIDLPADQKVTLKTRAGFEATPVELDGRRIYRWTHANLEREDDKDDAKPPKPASEHPAAAIRLTTFQSWEQVGEWFAALEAPQRVPTSEIKKKAAELTAGRVSDLEKLEVLYDFVATNFRYVSLSLGAGRYQPRAAADVLREQYGDCKDKHTLLASLIDAAGLTASAVLINSAAELDSSFPSPSQFDHVITRAVANGEAVWVDTTSEVAPFRLLPFGLRNKQALVVHASGPPHLEETPANPPMKSLAVTEIEAKLDDAGKLEARVRMTHRGDTELLLRSIFRRIPAAQWKRLLEEMAKAEGTPGEVSNWTVSDPAALKDAFTIEFDLSAARYARWNSNKASVSLPFTSWNTPQDTDSDDASPLQLGAAPLEVAYKLQLQLPANVTARAPLPVSLERDYAGYRATYAVTGSTLVAERRVVYSQSELPAERRQDYAAFARVVTADTNQLLSLETTAAIAAAPEEGVKASELNKSGYEAVQAGNYAQAVTLLKRVVELEPKHKAAWNNLGRAHMGLREYEAAIEAYRKQIDVNAYDAYAYNNLGRAYQAQQKYDEAEAAFKKQIEVNPLDEYAPANLGGLYVERRQYEAAVPYLEKAIALKSDNSWLHVQLGKAHLSLKHETEAMAAFDRAVELSPTPGMWNNVAYELSLRGVHLDRALQYAESAVSSATAASRNLDISRADEKSLAVVRSLAAYWDTLGWVYVARGDLVRAERFVDAAWKLAQHAEVGDHLAQIYEKLGRTDAAIQTYALALSAERPGPEIRERLARLLGDDKRIDDLVARHRADLSKLRSIPVSAKAPAGKSAEFLVMFSSAATVEAVRFVSGDEVMASFTDAIRAAPVGRLFPDDVPAKILRKGIFACASADAGCTLILLLPDDVRPVK